MPKTPLRVAVAGAGMIANKAHIPAYRAMGAKVELVGVSDLNPEAARETAQRHGIPRSFADAARMINDVKPDLVSICAPNALHRPMAEAALSAGCSVLCEKPLALTYADTKALFDLAAAKGLSLFACQNMRYAEPYRVAKELAGEGVFGNFYFSEISLCRRRGVPKWGTFHQKAANGGGAFCDLGVHMIDSVLWVMGNPGFESISGSMFSSITRNEKELVSSLAESGAPAGVNLARPFSQSEFEVEEFAAGSMRFAGGVAVNFKISWALNLPPEYSVKIAGDRAGIILPQAELYSSIGRYQADIKPRLFGEGRHRGEDFAGHFYYVENVVGALLGENEPLVKPSETLNVAAVIDAFYRSAAEYREVYAKEITGA